MLKYSSAVILVLLAIAFSDIYGFREIDCDVLEACSGNINCLNFFVYKMKLDYCLTNGEREFKTSKRTGRLKIRDILLNSYLNRV
uniref:Nodule Cysteine-Rich (NCR) secreted peptide n=1 Tax=Heterorhabditis bacteriophora TaxID=37862 RepID=A0A1I7X5H7_HETBA